MANRIINVVEVEQWLLLQSSYLSIESKIIGIDIHPPPQRHQMLLIIEHREKEL